MLKFRNTKWHLLQGYLGAEAISTRLHKQSVASHCFGLVYGLFTILLNFFRKIRLKIKIYLFIDI